MCDCKPDRRFLIALLDYCAARVNKTHIPFQVRRSCTVHVTSVCDRHLVDIYSPYMHGGEAHRTLEGAVAQRSLV